LGAKEHYLKGDLRSRWGEIRSDWCWIIDDNPPAYCRLRKTPVVRGSNWSDLDPQDKKLEIATTRILRLREAGLTIGMVGADFLRRRIAPLQQRGRPASEWKNPADIMRLRPGLINNFTILQHDFFMRELFKQEIDPEKREKAFTLPKHIVPLCNNSALSPIIAMMPRCNAHSVEVTWDVPSELNVRQFFDTTVEKPIRDEKKWLVRDTTEQELEFIARRVEEDQLAREAGEYGHTLAEHDEVQEEGLAGEGMLAGEDELAAPGEGVGPSGPAGESSSSEDEGSPFEESTESLPQAEPPTPAGRKRLRKLGEMAERQEVQQPPERRSMRSTTARTDATGASCAVPATGAGSSKTTTTTSAKRPRSPAPPPPPPRPEADFDFSTLSEEEEDEEE
jgi:hypothetical protein